MQSRTSLNTVWFVMHCRQVLESMFEWLLPPTLRVVKGMHSHLDAISMQSCISLNILWFVMLCRQVLGSMFEWQVFQPLCSSSVHAGHTPTP